MPSGFSAAAWGAYTPTVSPVAVLASGTSVETPIDGENGRRLHPSTCSGSV